MAVTAKLENATRWLMAFASNETFEQDRKFDFEFEIEAQNENEAKDKATALFGTKHPQLELTDYTYWFSQN